ncbi:hypothetical protein ACJRO7_034359, partial [Eucalyptus globulus]
MELGHRDGVARGKGKGERSRLVASVECWQREKRMNETMEERERKNVEELGPQKSREEGMSIEGEE